MWYEWQADLSEGFLIYSYMYIYEEHTSSFHPSPSPAVTHWWKSALQFDVNWEVYSNIKTRISNLRSDHRYVYHNIYGIQEGDVWHVKIDRDIVVYEIQNSRERQGERKKLTVEIRRSNRLRTWNKNKNTTRVRVSWQKSPTGNKSL